MRKLQWMEGCDDYFMKNRPSSTHEKKQKHTKENIISMTINVQYVFSLITHIFGKDAIYVGPYDFRKCGQNHRIQL